MPAQVTATLETLRLARCFPASRERVFHALTAVDELKAWWELWSHATGAVSIDLRVGGSFRIEMQLSDGRHIAAFGTYLDIRPPERLTMTWSTSGRGRDDGETVLRLDVEEKGAATELTLVHENLPKTALGRYEAGWSQCFDRLGEHLGQEGWRGVAEPHP